MFTKIPTAIQSFESSMSPREQKEILLGLHFSLSRFYFDDSEYSTPEQETFRFIRLHKTFSFDGINTTSSLDIDEETEQYLQHRQSVYIQVKLTGMYMEQQLHLGGADTIDAELFGIFDIFTQKNENFNNQKVMAPLLRSSNMYILKTANGVSYHLDTCGEFTKDDFFEALSTTPAFQELYDRFYIEAEKMELEAQTPHNVFKEMNARLVHKI